MIEIICVTLYNSIRKKTSLNAPLVIKRRSDEHAESPGGQCSENCCEWASVTVGDFL